MTLSTLDIPNLDPLFQAKSLAVVGASDNTKKFGNILVQNIVNGQFAGRFYPINPKGAEICGRASYASILDIPEESLDLAIVLVPAALVLDSLIELAQKKTKFVVICSSGFAETGNQEGQDKIFELGRKHNMRILGPNLLGFYSAAAKVNGLFLHEIYHASPIAMITQSGGLGHDLICRMKEYKLGFDSISFLGNRCDLNENELLAYQANNPRVKVILLYLEGLADGVKFQEELRKATLKKPVIILKSGRSAKGAALTASHTASLAGEDGIFDRIIRQCGAIRAESAEEAVILLRTFLDAPIPKGENCLIMGFSGAHCTLAADIADKRGINLFADKEKLKKLFSIINFHNDAVDNPMDIGGSALLGGSGGFMDIAEMCLPEALKSDDIDSIVAMLYDMQQIEGQARRIGQLMDMAAKCNKPVIFVTVGPEAFNEELDTHTGVPRFQEMEDAFLGLSALLRYAQFRKENEKPLPKPAALGNQADIAAVLKGAQVDGRHFLLADEASRVVKAAAISMAESIVARTLPDAIAASKAMDFPLVMKVVSKDVIHKSDAGGVILSIKDQAGVEAAWETIHANIRKNVPGAVIAGIEVCEMVKNGVEAIVAAKRDPVFGPIVMVGMGGIYVEVFKDVQFRGYPLSHDQVIEMIKDTRMMPLLEGVRGEQPKDLNALADAVLKLGALVATFEDITDIELNPVKVYDQGSGLKAVDARILLKE